LIEDLVLVLFNNILVFILVVLLFLLLLLLVSEVLVEEGSREVSREASGLMRGVEGSARPSVLVFNALFSKLSKVTSNPSNKIKESNLAIEEEGGGRLGGMHEGGMKGGVWADEGCRGRCLISACF
jgi:hypothetical protein